MDITAINQLLNDAKLSIDEALVLVNEGSGTIVKAGEPLQPALDKAGKISLEAGATWEGNYIVRSDTVLTGNGAKINGTTGPALSVLSGSKNVTISDIIGNTKHDQQVFLTGKNDSTQSQLAQVPTEINWIRCKVPTYRGKRAFEMNGTGKFIECEVHDLWDPAGRDSQGIAIANTMGPVFIDGCLLTAGSEIIMSGGDNMDLPVGTVPTGLTIQNSTLYRPDSWRTDGVKRGVKNCLELKSGVDVTIKNVTMDGCWKDGQDGWALVLTPRNSLPVKNVLIDTVTVRNCSGFMNLKAQDGVTHTPYPVTGVFVKNSTGTMVSKVNGGRGWVALITSGPGSVRFEDSSFNIDGSTVVGYSHDNYMDANGQVVPAGKMDSFIFRNTVMNNVGLYSFFFDGNANGNKWQGSCNTCVIEGNTFPLAPRDLKTNFPNNTYPV